MKIIRPKLSKYHLRDIMFINNCRRIYLKFGIYIILLGVAVLVALLPNVIRNNQVARQQRFPIDLKYILFWKTPKKSKKTFFNRDEVYPTGQKAFIKQRCPYINCFITYNKSLLQTEDNFDAVVFNIHDLKRLKVPRLNKGRSPHQKYIFKSFDSAEKHPACHRQLDGFFNWTWTYKLDSDIPQPHINILDTKKNCIGPSNKIKWNEDVKQTDMFKKEIKSKTKAIAWFIKSCKLMSKHMDFIKDLKGELKGYNYTVDMFGPCTKNKCEIEEHCYKKITKEYYFQLVLEDSVSQDYVTDIMADAMSLFSVPIVLGSNFSSFLPPGSYINAGTFDLKKLGAVIDYLIKNPKQYRFFFDWKNFYSYTKRPRTSICDLCTKLNEDNSVKSIENFRRWWNTDFEEICESNYLYKKFNEM